MSEEILKALMELFALIVKQDRGMISYERDYVLGFLKKQLSKESVNEYLKLLMSSQVLQDKKTRQKNALHQLKTLLKYWASVKNKLYS